MSDTFKLSLGLAHELEQAFARTGWTSAEVKELTKGDTLVEHLDASRGVSTIVKLFNPREYFTTREGIIVSSQFGQYVLPLAKPVRVKGKMWSYDPPRNMNREEICVRLGKDHVFEDASRFCALLGDMLDAQARGNIGEFVTDGRRNSFYVLGIGAIVHVWASWKYLERSWTIEMCRYGDFGADFGDRIFSASMIPCVN